MPIFDFGRAAMAAEFRIVVAGTDRTYARSAVRAAFDELESLEARLSRFRPDSDAARISSLHAGESVRVAPDTWRCFEAARRMRDMTRGAFDVTAGTDGSRHGRLVFSRHGLRVTARRAGARVDFGAIGKGYALDRMAAVLAEWDLPAALLSGGESTVLALDPPPGADGWTVGIRDPWRQSRGRLWRPDETLGSVVLRRCAFSGSGTAENGPHILDPATGRPVTGRPAAWAAAPGAAEADALSTAFMVMRLTDVVKLCRRGGGISGIIAANTPRGYAVRLAGPARGKGFKIWMFHRDLKRGKPAIPPGRR